MLMIPVCKDRQICRRMFFDGCPVQRENHHPKIGFDLIHVDVHLCRIFRGRELRTVRMKKLIDLHDFFGIGAFGDSKPPWDRRIVFPGIVSLQNILELFRSLL